MVSTCVAYGCNNRLGKNNGSRRISFHKFPKDEQRRLSWQNAIRRKNWKAKDTHYICSEHFEEFMIDKTGQTTRLRENAIPTIFSAFPSHLQKPKKAPRGVTKVRKIIKESMDSVEQMELNEKNKQDGLKKRRSDAMPLMVAHKPQPPAVAQRKPLWKRAAKTTSQERLARTKTTMPSSSNKQTNGEIHQSRFIRLKPLAVPTLNLPTAKLDRRRNGQSESGNRLKARTCSTMSQAHETANDPASELLGNSLSAQTKSLSAELHKPKLSTSISSLAEFPKTKCATCLDETTVENKEYIMPVVDACFVASESRISNEMDYYSETCDEEYITPDFIEQNTRLKSTEADEELDIKPDIKSLELERWTNTKLESPPTNVEELDVKPFAAQNPS